MSKELIYFPSLSTFVPQLKKDKTLINDFSYRFYDKQAHGKFYHPYFLLTAGALYKKKTIREDLGMQDTLVFGDSGGFQIATGALKWDLKLREDIFHWLEGNSDIAMNIDIPLFSKGRSFQECLDITVDNMKWFEKNQSGKTAFLNALHGNNDEQTMKWFNATKDFEFKGWGMGSANGTVTNFCKTIMLMLKHKEFDKKNFKWFHFLGKTGVHHFFMYAMLQKKLNQYFPHIQVTTDSSTPAMQAVFGNWYHSVNYKDLSFVNLYYGNKGKTNYVEDAPLPCTIDCPMCDNINFGHFANHGSTDVRFFTSYHNLWIMIKAMNDITEMTNAHFEIFEGMMDRDFIKVLKSINDMFDSGNPEKVFEDSIYIYKTFEKKPRGGTSQAAVAEVADLFSVKGDDNTVEANEFQNATKEQKVAISRIEQGLSMNEEDDDFYNED